ncbi:polyprenyl synthetase family protein [Gammaproteobacteria bacterium]|nr:polyprenyl synthetase family protein [Gammaproteobacteria bacterium]
MTSFKKRIPEYRELIDDSLNKILPASNQSPKELNLAMAYSVLNGGKRIRPLMMLASAKTLDIDIQEVIPFAASIELLHSFSLIHDDLPCMDDDSFRRGQPTTHIKFGEATATLAADSLQSLAFESMTQANFPKSKSQQLGLISMIAKSIGSAGMAGGQSLDLDSENKKLDAASVEKIYMLKTGKLLQASILAPTFFKGMSDMDFFALKNFSESIGIAFQIQDDLIEAEGDLETIGKSIESDKSKNKAAYPLLFGLDASKNRVESLYQKASEALQIFGEKSRPLKEMAEIIIYRKF